VAAATAVATARDLPADDAVVVNDSNRLVVRLLPADVVARVTPLAHHEGHHASPRRELEIVRRLEATEGPIAGLDPRVEPHAVEHDGFWITLWAHVATVERALPAAEYAAALARLHLALRQVDLAVPHIGDRVGAVQRDVANRDITPELGPADRDLVGDALRDLGRAVASSGAGEQLLHGEPHPDNVLVTTDGPLFVDFENAARGPLEYDLAWVPEEVSRRHPSADQELVDRCRGLVLAMVTAYRWRGDDAHPSGREGGVAFLDALRAGPPWPSCDGVTW